MNANKQFIEVTNLLEKYKKLGKLTEIQYNKALDKVLKDFEKYTNK